jgi:PAS domain S-box-containing protein
MGEQISVLLVEDDPDFADVATTFLDRVSDDIETEVVLDPESARTRLPDDDIDCVVSDYEMPDTNGLEMLRLIRERDDTTPFILFTGKGSEEIASEAISAGVTDYLQKAGTADQFELLANRIRQAVSRAEAEEALRRSERQYRAMVEASPVPMVVYSPTGTIRFANQAAAELGGVDGADGLVGRRVTEFVHPEHRDLAMERMATLFETGEPQDPIEYTLVEEDGSERHAIASAAPVHFEGDLCAQAVLNDITEQKEREEQFRSIAEASYDVIFRVDAEGRFTYLSPALERVLGYQPIALEGEHFESVLRPEALEEAADAFRTVLEGEPVEDVVLTAETADGTEAIISMNALPIPDDEGVAGAQGVVREVTDQRERQRELERQNERLQHFTSVVSHDLRNPLNVATSSTELIADDCDSEHLPRLERSLDRMGTLIDELLALAKQGEAVGETEPVGLRGLAEGCWETVETDGAELTVERDVRVQADEHRFHELLSNLFANAVDHAGEDATVTVGTLDDGSGFFVADDGEGISEDEREDVWEPGHSSDPQGTGFGLSIVKEIAEAHGWSVEITESRTGGARFEFRDARIVDSDCG